MSNELIELISFQKRVCENQLHSYKSIMNESHPRYILLKEEYQTYVLLENIANDLENVDPNQVETATQILNKAIEDFKNALKNQQLNEILGTIANKIGSAVKGAGKVVRGLTTGHDINTLEKEKNIKEFMTAYSVFKPLSVAVNIIDHMIEQAKTQGNDITAKSFQNLKLPGTQGQEIKKLIIGIASRGKIDNIKNAIKIIQNVTSSGSASTNPVLSNFISNDLVNNKTDVGLQYSQGAAPLRGHGGSKTPDWITQQNAELDAEETPQQSKQSPTEEEPTMTGSLFGGHAGGPQQTQPNVKTNAATKNPRIRSKFKQVAKQVGMSEKDAQTMIRSGFAKWAEENPNQLKQLADLLSGSNVVSETKRINLIVNFVEKSKSEKKLVTEVINKWNKLAGLKG